LNDRYAFFPALLLCHPRSLLPVDFGFGSDRPRAPTNWMTTRLRFHMPWIFPRGGDPLKAIRALPPNGASGELPRVYLALTGMLKPRTPFATLGRNRRRAKSSTRTANGSPARSHPPLSGGVGLISPRGSKAGFHVRAYGSTEVLGQPRERFGVTPEEWPSITVSHARDIAPRVTLAHAPPGSNARPRAERRRPVCDCVRHFPVGPCMRDATRPDAAPVCGPRLRFAAGAHGDRCRRRGTPVATLGVARPAVARILWARVRSA
jgi:hypothetical protein